VEETKSLWRVLRDERRNAKKHGAMHNIPEVSKIEWQGCNADYILKIVNAKGRPPGEMP